MARLVEGALIAGGAVALGVLAWALSSRQIGATTPGYIRESPVSSPGFLSITLAPGRPEPGPGASVQVVNGTILYQAEPSGQIFVNPQLPDYEGGFRIVNGRPVGV